MADPRHAAPDPIAVDVAGPVELQTSDGRVQLIAAAGAVLALLVGLVLVGILALQRVEVPGEFWTILGTLAGAPLLLLQRR